MQDYHLRLLRCRIREHVGSVEGHDVRLYYPTPTNDIEKKTTLGSALALRRVFRQFSLCPEDHVRNLNRSVL